METVSRGSKEKELHVTFIFTRTEFNGIIYPKGMNTFIALKVTSCLSGRTCETIPSNLTCKRVWSHGYVTGLIAFRIKPKCLAYLERERYDPLNVSRGSRVLRYSLLLSSPLSSPPQSSAHSAPGITLRLSRTTKPRRTSAYMHTDALHAYAY